MNNDISEEEKGYLPKIITHLSEPSATLREFICPLCGTEWISDWNEYEIHSPLLGSPPLGYVEVTSHCPRCYYITEGLYPDPKTTFNKYKNFIEKNKTEEEKYKETRHEQKIPDPEDQD